MYYQLLQQSGSIQLGANIQDPSLVHARTLHLALSRVWELDHSQTTHLGIRHGHARIRVLVLLDSKIEPYTRDYIFINTMPSSLSLSTCALTHFVIKHYITGAHLDRGVGITPARATVGMVFPSSHPSLAVDE